MAAYRLRAWSLLTNKLLSSNQIINTYAKSRFKSDDVQQNASWNLFAALCIQRVPVITRDPLPLEIEFNNLTQVMEYENSLLSDHEMNKATEKKNKIKQQQDVDFDAETSVLQTTEDLEDIWKAEFETFSPAPRISEEQNANRRSLKRYLDRRLYLVIKDKQIGDWRLPACIHKDGETMRQTADRTLSEVLGDQLNVKVLSNAPIGFYKFRYSREIDRNSVPNKALGGRVFFYRAYHINGDLDLTSDNSEVGDYAWLNTEELIDILVSRKPYLKAVQRFLMDESFTYKPSTIYQKKQNRKEGKAKMYSHS